MTICDVFGRLTKETERYVKVSCFSRNSVELYIHLDVNVFTQKDGNLEHVWCAYVHLSLVESIYAEGIMWMCLSGFEKLNFVQFWPY